MGLAEFLQLLKERWYLLVIIPLVFACVTAAYCWLRMPDVYTSTASLYVLGDIAVTDSSGNTKENTDQGATDFNKASTVAGDVSALAKSKKVTTEAAKKAGLSSLDGYTSNVTAGSSSSGSARVLNLSVSGSNPETAALIANALASQLTEVADTFMNMGGMNVIDAATPPSAPSGPNRLKYVLIALGAGVIAALMIILVLDMLNQSVRSEDDAEKEFGLPVLGKVPYVKRLK